MSRPYDASTDYSPPRTPPSQSATYKPSKRSVYARPALREAFSDDITTAEEARSGNDSGDDRDPHDLSLSPKHAARTSIVDNMLLSLDQFATSPSVLDDYRLFNSALESDMYNRSSQDSPMQNRYRGNTFSSSLSSDTELGHETEVDRYGRHTGRASREHQSDGGSNYKPGLGRVGNARNWESQRYHATGRGSKGSAASNTDFEHTISKNQKGSEGEVCSARFDYGSHKAFTHLPETASGFDELPYDESDAAPTPSVPAGPRKPYVPQNEYSGTLNHQSSRTSGASRRNSTTSAHTSHSKKPRPANIGTATIRSRDNDLKTFGETGLDPPPAIPATLDPPAPSPTISYNKPLFPQPEPAQPKERPGFFRRVFGSSKNSSQGPAEQGQTEPPSLQDSDTKDSTPSSINLKGRRQQHKNNTAGTGAPSRDGPSQVVNKKSSFFRRRKKSVVDSVPPPIFIPQEVTTRLIDTKAEPSPVSSLRQVMNPYLADVSSSAYHDSKEITDPETEAQHTGGQSLARPPKQKRSSALAPNSGSRSQYERDHSATPFNNDYSGLQSRPEDCQLQSKDRANSNDNMDKPASNPQLARTSQNNETQQPIRQTALPAVAEDLPQKNTPPAEIPKDNPPSSENGTKESSHLAPLQDRPDGPGRPPPAEGSSGSPTASTSETSNYYTASNTPVIPFEEPKSGGGAGMKADISTDIPVKGPTEMDREQAWNLFDSQDQVVGNEPAAAWLGDVDRQMVREAYMSLFDWSDMNILAALRSLCTRLVLKGETQQVDRVLDAFSTRWCECNPCHGFKSAGMHNPSRDVFRSNVP